MVSSSFEDALATAPLSLTLLIFRIKQIQLEQLRLSLAAVIDISGKQIKAKNFARSFQSRIQEFVCQLKSLGSVARLGFAAYGLSSNAYNQIPV